MTLGMLYFIGSGWGVRDPEQEQFYVITIFITAIAAASYFSMATGYGLTEIEVAGEALDIYWARYADWLFTTPLLLLDLSAKVGFGFVLLRSRAVLDAATDVTRAEATAP